MPANANPLGAPTSVTRQTAPNASALAGNSNDTSAPYADGPDMAGSRLIQHRLLFNDLIHRAENCVTQSWYEAAVAYCQLAARVGFVQHTGLFGSDKLESLLAEAAKRSGLDQGTWSRSTRTGRPLRVAHVLTYARETGGDTRFVWRWIRSDITSIHSVFVTRRRDGHIPSALSHAVQAAGGQLVVLRTANERLIDQARELQQHLAEYDVVLLHLFPDDIVPSLALCGRSRGVALLNHSDHTFWVGRTVSNLLVQLRSVAAFDLAARRGINPAATALVPIPLDPVSCDPADKSKTKRALGLSDSTVVLLTVATAFKYESLGFRSFLDAVTPVLQTSANAVLVAVGPSDTGAWQQANVLTGNRIIAMGSRTDTAALYAAADIYLDSAPFSSITSLLEAGSRGIPLLSFVGGCPRSPLLRAGAPGLDPVLLTAETVAEYGGILRRLIRSPAWRAEIGARTRATVFRHHIGDGWREYVKDMYAQLDSQTGSCAFRFGDNSHDDTQDVLLERLLSRLSIGLGSVIDKYFEPLPYLQRLISLLYLRTLTSGFSRSLFLPPTLQRIVQGRLATIHRLRMHPVKNRT